MKILAVFVVLGLCAVATMSVVASRASAEVEQPAYTLIVQDGPFELRRYPALVVARVDRAGSRGRAVQRSFRPLANYIFAKERSGEKIAMTAPVLQEPTDQGWTVSFIMPAGRTLYDLPETGSDVRLEELPARIMAAYRFSGTWTDKRFADGAAKLTAWLQSKGRAAIDAPEFGYYNDPFTPAFLRRNEVFIEVSD